MDFLIYFWEIFWELFGDVWLGGSDLGIFGEFLGNSWGILLEFFGNFNCILTQSCECDMN